MSSTSLPDAETADIGGSLRIPRIVNGLWQLADCNNAEETLVAAAAAMKPLIAAGFTTFDMADHYGPAELIVGKHNATASTSVEHLQPITAFTKWCPTSPDTSPETTAAAISLALTRMATPQIDLLQYHAWDFTAPTYLAHMHALQQEEQRGRIRLLGVTNTDAAHLELLLHSGFPIATNQVCVSVLDRRLVRGPLAGVCAAYGVGVLAYGVLLGGFLHEKWLGAPEPDEGGRLTPSEKKYLRFIRAAGGWTVFQVVLQAVAGAARKHGVSVAAVAIRWVLDIEVVKAVIIGTSLGTNSRPGQATAGYEERNLQAFAFRLDDEDRAAIARAQEGLKDIPGDCGDEYRRPPFLTAAGDLSDHLRIDLDAASRLEEAITAGQRIEFHSGSKWEPIAGYCRAVRTGAVIRVSGTTANPPPELADVLPAVGGKCARCQAVAALDIITHAIKKLGGAMSDVVRTRVMIRHQHYCDAVSRVHGRVFSAEGIHPSNTLTTAGLIGDEMLVEMEAQAVVGSGREILKIV